MQSTASAAVLEAERWMCGSATTRLVVWDFDQTLLKIHAFAEGVEPKEVAGRWRDDVADAELVKAFADKAREHGISLGIASFGRGDVIREYLQHIAPGAFRPQDIVTPSSLGLPDVEDGMQVEDGKPLMLELLSRRASPAVTDKKAVLFFDDDPENIIKCQQAGFTRSVHTPDGFTRAALAALNQGAGGGSKARVCTVA